ncbi:MAG: aminotransferase class V-fold PLP-dependent enzyme, partial [Patescibacteria group bacterium]|nr:aminotransferase class V-fold PLP-dependent enzyme [Patescibacteria group bacterium]
MFIKNPQKILTAELKKYLRLENILLLKSARQGIMAVIKNLNLAEGDEVIISSFICPVVPEAIIEAGAKPVFCDIGKEGFNMDADNVEKLITNKTRVIILSYVFGTIAPINKFVEICRKNNLVLIEDCAQCFGAKYKER